MTVQNIVHSKPASKRRATIANLISQHMSLLLAVTSIILVPLYLRFIDIELYGAWLASGNIIGWLSMLDPGLNELLRQQVAKFFGQKDWDNLGRIIGTNGSSFVPASQNLLKLSRDSIILGVK